MLKDPSTLVYTKHMQTWQGCKETKWGSSYGWSPNSLSKLLQIFSQELLDLHLENCWIWKGSWGWWPFSNC